MSAISLLFFGDYFSLIQRSAALYRVNADFTILKLKELSCDA